MQQLGKFNINMSPQEAFKFFGQRMPDDIAQTIGGRPTSDEDMFERMRNRKVVRRFNEEMEKGAPTIYKVKTVQFQNLLRKV
jgi:beta-phosphoglucomutase-like phosphatase (HAD superfamily)